MNRIASAIVAALVLSATVVNADSYYISSDKNNVKTGEWNDQTDAVLDKAESEHIPVVIVGTALGCTWCASFKSGIMSSAQFKNWMASSPYLFCYAYSGSGWWTSKPLSRVIKLVGEGALPRVGGYWLKEDGTVVGGKAVGFPGRGWSVQQYITFFDNLFAGYSPNKNDEWDPADDTKDGATTLEPAAAASETPLHYLSAGNDQEDWFKVDLTSGKRYQFFLSLSTYEKAAPKIEFISSDGTTVLKTYDLSKDFDDEDALVFTPEADGTHYFRFYYASNVSEGTSTYKLAYREYEPTSFTFDEDSMELNEDAGTAKIAVTRAGRLTDAVVATVWTEDGTAEAGTNYTAISNTVSFAANKTTATVSIPVKDIEGAQGNLSFMVKLSNPEGDSEDDAMTVTVIDLDVPTDEKDPGDDVRSGATEFTIVDQTSTVKELEGENRVVSGQDTADWYVLQSMEAGKTYQVKVPKDSYSKRPATAASDPQVFFYVGGSEEPFDSQSLASLMEEPYRFTAEESGDLVLLVTNEVADATVYTYDLAWQEWVLPVVEFTNETATIISAGFDSSSATVTLKRTKNLEESVTVQVATSAVEGRVAEAQTSVTFAAGADTATFSVPLFSDGGLWRQDETFTLTVLDDAEVHQNAVGAIHQQTVTLKTEMPEFDADDGDGNVNASADTATQIDVSKRPTTRSGLTLNGSDHDDWYSFPVEAGVEYVFEILDVIYSGDGEVPLAVQLLLPGESVATDIPLEDCLALPYHFIPQSDGVVAIGIRKPTDDPQSVEYALKYREWVPATIGFTQAEIQVSEMASSVRIPVQCDMEVSLPVAIAVTTEDGTAKAGEDYVALDTTLEWWETSPTSSVQYATVDLKKLSAKYEGEFETFKVLLDFSESDAIEGEITEMTVKILESDVGAAGTFAIDGYSFDESVTYPYQARAISVTAGDKVNVHLVRTDGDAGAVAATLTWSDKNMKPVVVDFADLETEKWVELTIPESDGAYVARQTLGVTLTTNVKTAKVKNAKLTFIAADSDKTLSECAKDKANVPFSAAGNSWYQAADGTIRSKTLTAANQSATLSATIKGSGVLSFRPVQTGTGAFVVKAGSKTLEQQESAGVVSVSVPSGTQRISVVFTASAAGAWLAIEDVEFTPDAAFNRTGTFNGKAQLSGKTGAFTFTASAKGRVSGKITLTGNEIWTVTGVLVDGQDLAAVVRRGRQTLTATLAVDENGFATLAGDDGEIAVDATASRNGWTDRPLTGAFVENAAILGQKADLVDSESGETLTFKVDARGQVRVAGKHDGKSVSLSTALYICGDDKVRATLVNRNLGDAVEVQMSLDESGALVVE